MHSPEAVLERAFPMADIPVISFRDGNVIPQVGFGVFKIPDEEVTSAVSAALSLGYRHIDTASVYGNEKGTGAAINASGIAREDLFVTTKLARTEMGRDNTFREFDASLERLGLDYVDLYLIHWPVPSQDLYVETWQALLEIRQSGRARSVGVSNFQIPHLERLAAETGELPVINQIELHPFLPQAELRAFHKEHGIVTQAWSPLAKGGEHLNDRVLVEIAEKHGRTPAQVLLRWHIQLGNVVIPKSVSPSRMALNLAIFDFELSPEDFSLLATLNSGLRTGPNPDDH